MDRAQWEDQSGYPPVKRSQASLDGALVAAIIQWLLRWAMMSLASATGSVVKGAAS